MAEDFLVHLRQGLLLVVAESVVVVVQVAFLYKYQTL